MFWSEEWNRRQTDRRMDRIIARLVPVAQQKHVSQTVCLSHGDFDSRFAQAGQAEKHLYSNPSQHFAWSELQLRWAAAG